MVRRPFGIVSYCVVLAALGAAVSGCGGSDINSETRISRETITLSGSVGDGPIVRATVTVRDARGSIVAATASDSKADYEVTLPAGVAFPITIAATEGTDTVTNAPPSFAMRSALANPRGGVANVNPHSTMIVAVARAMPGGLTAQNLQAATAIVLEALNFGLDPRAVPAPIGTRVTAGNVAGLVKASEALAEMIRRTRSTLVIAGLNLSADEIVDVLAGDLTDGVMDGIGKGADARIAATATLVSAKIAVESLVNRLQVDGGSATARLDAAIQLTAPEAAQATSDVLANAELLSQAKTAVSAAHALAPSTALSSLRAALDHVPSGSSPSDVDALLPASAEQSLDAPLTQIMAASEAGIKAVNSRVRDGAVGSGSGGATAANIAATSPANYLWGSLQEGELVYVDRAYTFAAVPARLTGLQYLQTANADKASTDPAFVSFISDENLTVYMAYDPGVSPRPAWLSDWTATGEQLVTTDKALQVFGKDFGAGTVTIGGNAGTSNDNMYTLIVDARADSDGDGMPDHWETANGLDPSGPTDASADPDGDGLTNLQEYQSDTDPNTANTSDTQPLAQPDQATLEKDTSTVIAVLANDSGLDDTPISVSLASSPAHGTATVQTGNTVAYTPDAGYVGTDQFSYQIADADNDTALANVNVTVACSSCTSRSVSMTWSANTDTVLGYKVYFGPSGNASTLLADVPLGTTGFDPNAPSVQYDSATDLGAQPGDTVCFRVKAYNSAGASAFSSESCSTI